MISIIVSSINPEQKNAFIANIDSTIDVPYELLVHDNRETNWGLCKLYNFYAERAKYDILAFFHEDILFHTTNWGSIITDFYAKNTDAGIVGFAGSTLKTQTMSGWECHKAATRLNIIQRQNEYKVRRKLVNPLQEDFSRVLTVDGLALFVPKNVWKQYQFDEQTFRGFHFYDLDFSMQVSESYKNYVCYLISVEHFSKGTYPRPWFDTALLFQDKWKDKLPYGIHSYSSEVINRAEANAKYKLTRGELTYSWENKKISTIIRERLFLSFKEPYHFKYNLKLTKHLIKASKR